MKEIILAIIGSGAVFSFITFLITRHDSKKEKNNGIKKELQEIKNNQQEHSQDILRTQLLVLLADYPNEELKIIQTAEKYFVDKGGNWWMGSLFTDYCKERDIEIPNWFKDNK